jgi:hypothetical protein
MSWLETSVGIASTSESDRLVNSETRELLVRPPGRETRLRTYRFGPLRVCGIDNNRKAPKLAACLERPQ